MRITLRTIEDVVARRLGPLRARLMNATRRGVLKSLNDATGLARGQSTSGADQVDDDIEFITPWGISFRPAAGAESILWAIAGNAGHVLGMLFDRRVRLKDALREGELALHVGLGGQLVYLRQDGAIVVQAQDTAGPDTGASVTLTAAGDVIVRPASGKHILLGSEGATDFIALASLVKSRLDGLKVAFNTWAVVPNDGGGALKTALATWIAGSNAVAATKVKGE